jgi:hypothetical protein
MSVVVDMLYGSLVVSVPRLQGESYIQFESICCIRATFTKSWILLLQGIAEGGSFLLGFGKTTPTACPTKQEWFSFFPGMQDKDGVLLDIVEHSRLGMERQTDALWGTHILKDTLD